MSEYKVTGCGDCPFYYDGQRYEYEHYCKHPNSPQSIGRFQSDPEIETERKDGKIVPITPDWCPLKKEPLTLIYE